MGLYDNIKELCKSQDMSIRDIYECRTYGKNRVFTAFSTVKHCQTLSQ